MAKHRLQIEAEYQDKGVSKGIGSANASLSQLGALAGPVGLSVAGISTALFAVGKSALDTAMQVDSATSQMTAELGLTEDAASEFESVMKNIYAAGYGESFDDIANSLVDTANQLERVNAEMTDAQFEQFATDAHALAEVFDKEVNEVTAAAATLMDEFGLTSEEALNLVATGFQEGLNSSDDFLDTVGEYSGQFSDMGLTATEFFSVLDSGLQGGVLGTDKIADAFKEFNLIFIEGTDSQREAYDALGLDYDEWVTKVQEGSATVGEVALMVAERIGEIEDPIERDRIAYELFGTQAEDLTSDVIAGLDSLNITLADTEGAVDSVREANEDLNDQWQAATRQMQLALEPIGDKMIEIGLDIMPTVIKAIEGMSDALDHAYYLVQSVYNTWVDLWNTAVQFYNDTMAFLGFSSSSGTPGFATGTTSAPGGPAIVGEEGPEMVYLPQGAQVVPAAQSRQMMTEGVGGGGNYTFNITITGNAGAAEAERGVLSAMRMAGA